MPRIKLARLSATGGFADNRSSRNSCGVRSHLGVSCLGHIDQIGEIGDSVSKKANELPDGLFRVEAFVGDLGQYRIELICLCNSDASIAVAQPTANLFVRVGGIADRAGQQSGKPLGDPQQRQVIAGGDVRTPQILESLPRTNHQQNRRDAIQVGLMVVSPCLQVTANPAQPFAMQLHRANEPVVNLPGIRYLPTFLTMSQQNTARRQRLPAID